MQRVVGPAHLFCAPAMFCVATRGYRGGGVQHHTRVHPDFQIILTMQDDDENYPDLLTMKDRHLPWLSCTQTL